MADEAGGKRSRRDIDLKRSRRGDDRDDEQSCRGDDRDDERSRRGDDRDDERSRRGDDRDDERSRRRSDDKRERRDEDRKHPHKAGDDKYVLKDPSCEQSDAKRVLEESVDKDLLEDDDDEDDDDNRGHGRHGDDETHEELMKLTTSTLSSLIEADSVLRDLPTDVTVEEVAAQIALVQGQSIGVTLVRQDGERMTVVVAQNGRVLDLKRAVQRHLTLALTRAGRRHVKVNWRYVWRSNWLAAGATKLRDDNARLADVGVGNRTEVAFVKRLGGKHEV